MGIPINNVTRRVVFAASGTGPYAFTFEILAAGDIAVYRDDTLLTITTDYTVTINTNGTGSVTLTAAPTGATQIAIVGNRTISRTSDFVTGGDFFANTLNDELDQQTIFAQQNAEGLTRSLQAPQTDPTTINMTLPRASLRANKTLGFDSNGNPTLGETLGTNRGNWAASTLYYVRDIVKDTSNNNIWQCLVQHTSSGSQPISTNVDAAKWSLLVDSGTATTAAANAAASAAAAATSESNAAASELSANDWATKTSGPVAGGEYSAKYHATAAATSASNASTSASNAATAQTAAEAARDATLAAYDSFDDRYLGSKASNPTVDNDGNALVAGALYFNTTVPEMRLYTGSAWVAAYVSGGSYLPLTGGTLTGTMTAPGVTISASVGKLSITSTSNIYSRIDFGDAADSDIGMIYYDHPNNAMKFYTNNTEQMAISNAGVLSVGGNTVLDSGDLGVSVQAYDADTAKTDVAQTFTAAQRGGIVALTDGASITPDFAAGNNFSVTLGGNRTLENPTNIAAGQSGAIVITQNGTGSNTLAYGSYWKFPNGTAPTLTTTADAVDVLVYFAESATRITARLVSDTK